MQPDSLGVVRRLHEPAALAREAGVPSLTLRVGAGGHSLTGSSPRGFGCTPDFSVRPLFAPGRLPIIPLPNSADDGRQPAVRAALLHLMRGTEGPAAMADTL